jgi:hypothetical protein
MEGIADYLLLDNQRPLISVLSGQQRGQKAKTEVNDMNEQHAKNIAATEANGVQCKLDGVWVHSIPAYLTVAHPTVTVEAYQNQFPDAKLRSPLMEAAAAKKKVQGATAAPSALQMNAQTNVIALHPEMDPWSFGPSRQEVFAKIFELGEAKAAKNTKGGDIQIEVLGDCGDELRAFIPAPDKNHIWNIDDLKAVMMGVQLRMNVLLWGMHGTGKTSLFEQYCARTNRPLIRVQHTATTEDALRYGLPRGRIRFRPAQRDGGLPAGAGGQGARHQGGSSGMARRPPAPELPFLRHW